MKLRAIILILSVLALLSTICGGGVYYFAIKRAAIHKLESEGAWRAATTRDLLDGLIAVNLKTVNGLSTLAVMQHALAGPDPAATDDLNTALDELNAALDASVVYLLDATGLTIASSNRLDPDSFVGKSYSFRPYFQQAIAGQPSVYLALGITSGLRGIYYSHVVRAADSAAPLGVLVLKASVDTMEQEILHTAENQGGAHTLITNPDGLIFMADSDVYRYQLLDRLSDEAAAALATSRQFGGRSVEWSGFAPDGQGRMVDATGARYFVARAPIAALDGWQVLYLQNVDQGLAQIHTALAKNLGSLILGLCLFIGMAVAGLYQMARSDIARRKRVEHDLVDSEEKFRSMSASINDGLLTIDDRGVITFWNDTAEKIFGYPRAEALGRELHPLLAPSRYQAAYNAAFATFRTSGGGAAIGKTLEMSALRKDGSEFPIELSLAAYHSNGRWHAVGTVRDISDRKRAEAEKEKLIAELQDALKTVRQLSGLLPICAHCKKIRDDKGYWNQIEAYIQQHSEAEFSHSICRECAAKYYPDIDIYDD